MVADVVLILRDLYLTYFLMVLESFNYFSTSLLFVLYLTQEFGVSDIEVTLLLLCPYWYCTSRTNLIICLELIERMCVQAGTLYGLWGTLLVANGIIFSPVIDLIGRDILQL